MSALENFHLIFRQAHSERVTSGRMAVMSLGSGTAIGNPVKAYRRKGISLKKLAHRKSSAGFSLVELLVASTLMVVAILSIVTIMRKGGEIELSDKHMRAARTIINSSFESPTYSITNFANLPNDQRAVIIDPRGTGTGDDLNGTLTVTVTNGVITGIYATPLTTRTITMTLTWLEPEGQSSVTLDRILSQ
jgi:competence protein ComGC